MAGLKAIKSKIQGVNKTHKVTKAMEAVSAVKMRKAQEVALLGRPYAHSALSILSRVSGSLTGSRHPLAQKHTEGKTCVVVITSDKGLAGSLNSAVFREVHRVLAEKKLTREDTVFIAIGKKGYEHFSKRGYDVLSHTVNVSDDVSPDTIANVSKEVVGLYSYERYRECLVAYTNFVSTFEQKAVVRAVLPLDVAELTALVSGIRPTTGKYAVPPPSAGAEGGGTRAPLYTIEPDEETVLNELLPFLINIHFYHALLESKASEHSARMVAMKNASDKARDLSKEWTREYNKARQSVITREVSEIVGGIEAMK